MIKMCHASLSILIYHRVLREPDPLQPEIVDAAAFERHMRWLRRLFRVLPLPDAVRWLKMGTLPGRAVCVTFDDGYADNSEVALPILRALDVPATFFVSTGFLDGGRMWNDTVVECIRRWPYRTLEIADIDMGPVPVESLRERQMAIRSVLSAVKYLAPARRDSICCALAGEVKEDLPCPMMRAAQVRELALAGMTVGAHTRNHPILTTLSPSEARSEIQGSRDELERITGESVACFAYPNGKPNKDFSAEHVDLVRKLDFSVGVSTSPGTARASSDPLQLPRFTPWDRSSMRYLARLWRARLTAPEGVTASRTREMCQ